MVHMVLCVCSIHCSLNWLRTVRLHFDRFSFYYYFFSYFLASEICRLVYALANKIKMWLNFSATFYQCQSTSIPLLLHPHKSTIFYYIENTLHVNLEQIRYIAHTGAQHIYNCNLYGRSSDVNHFIGTNHWQTVHITLFEAIHTLLV